MARDTGLEELIFDELRSTPGITDKAMFGGWAWLLGGKLLCGAREDGMLIRLGKGNDAWALAIKGIDPMISRGRPMSGWVRADSGAYGDDKLRRKLISSALQFVSTLPTK
jgi:TfoX N-terminal domain